MNDIATVTHHVNQTKTENQISDSENSDNDNNNDNNREEERQREEKVKNLVKTKHDLFWRQQELKKQLRQIEHQIRKTDEDIMRTCQHQWIKDPNYNPAPYEKPDLVCTKCGIINYRW